MSPRSRDTSPEAEEVLFDFYRNMDVAQKMHIIFDLQETMDQIALVGIRERHPDCSEREARLRLAALKYDRELMIRAFGWDPEVEGY